MSVIEGLIAIECWKLHLAQEQSDIPSLHRNVRVF